MQQPLPYPRFLPVGDAAITVEFGNKVDPGLNDKVIALDIALAAAELDGIRETVPSYRSLLVCYDPLEISFHSLVAELHGLVSRLPRTPANRSTLWTVPVIYDQPYAEDIPEVARRVGLSEEQVAAVHSAAEYHVYSIGYAPGMPYLGGVPPALHISRRELPRPQVKPGAVMIGGVPSGNCTDRGTQRLVPSRSNAAPAVRSAPSGSIPVPSRRSGAFPEGGSIRIQSPVRLAARCFLVADQRRCMTSALRAIAPGPYVTIQDAGRTGWRRFGVAGCGAMDMPAFAAANVLVGNVPNTAALEFAHVGGTWEVLAESAANCCHRW